MLLGPFRSWVGREAERISFHRSQRASEEDGLEVERRLLAEAYVDTDEKVYISILRASGCEAFLSPRLPLTARRLYSLWDWVCSIHGPVGSASAFCPSCGGACRLRILWTDPLAFSVILPAEVLGGRLAVRTRAGPRILMPGEVLAIYRDSGGGLFVKTLSSSYVDPLSRSLKPPLKRLEGLPELVWNPPVGWAR